MRIEAPSFKKAQRLAVEYAHDEIRDLTYHVILEAKMAYDRKGQITPHTNSDTLLSKRLQSRARQVEQSALKLEAAEAAHDFAYITTISAGFRQEGIAGVMHGSTIDIRRTMPQGSTEEVYSGTVCGQELDPEGAKIVWDSWGNTIKEIYSLANSNPRQSR